MMMYNGVDMLKVLSGVLNNGAEDTLKKLHYERALRCFRCLMQKSHRCRNEKDCPSGLHFEVYKGSTVRQCLCATVEIFQDGYIHCPIIECYTCEKCMQVFGDGTDFHHDESQNYDVRPEKCDYESEFF